MLGNKGPNLDYPLDTTSENPLLLTIGFDQKENLIIWNQRAKEVTGYTFEEAIEQRLSLFFKKFLSGNTKPDVKDVALKTRSGDICNIRIYPQILKKKSGKKIFLITGIDITEEQALRNRLLQKDQHIRRISKRLRKFVSSDSHTGVLNYRYLMGALHKAFYVAFEQGTPISMLLINLDYFHSVNSTHGISEGNRVLREAARIIEQSVGEQSFVGRFTGTQFAAVLPDTDVKTAFRKSQKIYAALTDQDFFVGATEHPISLSAHIAVGGFPHCEDVCTPEQLLNRITDDLKSIKDKGNSSPIIMCSTDRVKGKLCPQQNTMRHEESKCYKYTVEFVNALANTIKTKDHYTKEHSRAMSNYAVYIAKHMGMPEKDILNVKYGAVLHDIGKIGIDKMVLLKKGPLTPEEFKLVKQHPRIGAEIIRNVHPLKEVVPLILHHHERFDGSGYLEGLKGNQIPLGARIISLADVFQALTSDRPYRRALSDNEAFDIVKEYSGSYFDPEVVNAFFEVYNPA